MWNRHERAHGTALVAWRAGAGRSVRERVDHRDPLHRPADRGDERGRPPCRGAGDHRPRLDHRHGAVPARSRGSLPARLPCGVTSTADAIVVGAGICGAAAAFFLQERGMQVLLLDRGAVSSGTTGLGEGNVLVCDKPPGPERELTLLGRSLWEELGRRFPEARVTRKGALLISPGTPVPGAESPVCESGSDLAFKHSEPALAPGVAGVLEPGDLQVDPAGLTRALAQRVPVREHARVAAVEPGAVLLDDGARL